MLKAIEPCESVAKRRKNKAHGVSRGETWKINQAAERRRSRLSHAFPMRACLTPVRVKLSLEILRRILDAA